MSATAKTETGKQQLQEQAADYETDLYGWAMNQAELLRSGRLDLLDTANIAEELEDLGRAERRQLENRLGILLLHLLKWRYQPERRGNSWRRTIAEQRRRIPRLIRQNPGLQPLLAEVLQDAYGDALAVVPFETDQDRSHFPEVCPWTLEQVLDDGFWPE